MSNPKVSVIVCCHTFTFIFKFIDSVLKSVGVSYEVIVVSNEDMYPASFSPFSNVVSKEMPATKRNLGAKYAKGEYLAFFDDDVEIEPDCLGNLVDTLESIGGTGMVYGKLWNMEHRNRFDEAGGFLTWNGFIWSRAGQNDIDTGQFDKVMPILAGKSASCIVRKDVFNEVGGFDESFGILGEETDLSWRIWLKEYLVLFDHTAAGYHAFNTKFKPPADHYTSERVQFNGCRNYITMLIKNLGVSHLWIIPIHVSVWFGAGCAMLVTGKFRQGVNILRGLLYVVTHLKEILKKRSQIQSTRKVSDAQIFPLIFARPPRGYYWQRFSRYLRINLHG